MGKKPYEKIKGIAITIREISQKMLQLVNEMLDLSKFEAGKMVLNKADVALKPLVMTSLQMLDPVARQKEKAITLNADDGPGIAREQQERFFEKYAQLEIRASGSGSGTGLGLTVSQMIIEQHGGKVGYRDREPNGSIFYFKIPCEFAPPVFQDSPDSVYAHA